MHYKLVRHLQFFSVPTRDTGHSWQEAQIGFKAELSRLKNEPSNPEQMEFFVLFFCSLFPLLLWPTPFLFCLPLLLCCKASWGPRGRGHASQCRLAALWGKVIPWRLGKVLFLLPYNLKYVILLILFFIWPSYILLMMKVMVHKKFFNADKHIIFWVFLPLLLLELLSVDLWGVC